MFSYRKIVFGFKHNYQINDVLNFFKQQRSCSILISQHSAVDMDDYCDRYDMHYHGLVELNNGEGKIGDFILQLYPYCIYLHNDECIHPVEYLAYITSAPKQIIAQEIRNTSKLLDYLQTASSMKVEVLRRKMDKRISLLERNNKVMKFIDIILKSGYNINQSKNKDGKCVWYQKWLNENYETDDSRSKEAFETAMQVSLKIVLNSSILVLSDRFECQNGYLSPDESAQFVLDWCAYQNLDPKQFTKNLILCLDKKGGCRNTIYLQGASNSGKTYIVQSIIEACIYVGQVVLESTAYYYVWEKCVDKRLIVLREPHFSVINIDQLDKILSGSGTVIFKHNDVVDYLPPTPVIILANEHDWTEVPQLSEKIKKRFHCCYMNLKYYPNMNEKKLHPRWLTVLNKAFSRRNGLKAGQKDTKTTYEIPLKPSPDTNNVMQSVTEEHLNAVEEKASSRLQETCADRDLFRTPILVNKKQGSENTRKPNPKRPMIDTGYDGRRKKMNPFDLTKDE